MALIKCPYCGRAISSLADKCIFCGGALENHVQQNDTYPKYDIEQEVQRTVSIIPILKARSPQYAAIPDSLLKTVLLANQGKAAFFGDNATKQDYNRAYAIFDYLFKEEQLSIAAFYLGQMYEKGILVGIDYQKAFDYYVIAATRSDKESFSSAQGESIQAKVQMAKLLIGRKVKLKNVSDTEHYYYGLGCYLCAADDGNKAAQLLLDMLCSSKPSENKDESYYILHPNQLLKRAKAGDIEAIYDLGQLYASNYGPFFRTKYALKWFKKGADLGSRKCEYAYIVFLLAEDSDEYNNSPDQYEVFYQPDYLINMARQLFSEEPDMAHKITQEILVVSSYKRVQSATTLLCQYYNRYRGLGGEKEVSQIYISLVNESNSYVRRKPELPGYNKTE